MTTATIDLLGRQSCPVGEAVKDLEVVLSAPSFHLVASSVDFGFGMRIMDAVSPA
jgi:hypothetical protein